MIKKIFSTLWKLVLSATVLLFIASHFSTVIHDFSTRYVTHPVRGFYAALCNTLPIPFFEIGAVILVLAIPFLIWRYVGGFGRITPLLLSLEIILFGYLVTVGIDGAIPDKKDSVTVDESTYASTLESIVAELNSIVPDLPESIDFPESEIRALTASYAYSTLDRHFTHIPRVKTTIFDKMTKSLGVVAYYSPATAEVILRRSLPIHLEISASMHELMHFVGITEEDVAIYHSVAAMMKSKNEYIRYSALLEAYTRIAAEVYEQNADRYIEISRKLLPRVTKDIASRRDVNVKSELGDKLNDVAITLHDGRGERSYKESASLLVTLFENIRTVE